MHTNTILIVEDEYITGADLQRRLQKSGFNVPAVADTGKKAIALTGEIRPDLVLMDITLKEEMNGIQAAREINREYDIPVVFLTANSDESTLDDAIRAEPFGYLTKPVDDRALKTTIQMALYKHAMDARLRASEEQYRSIANLIDESIFIIARDYSVTYLNTCAADLAGLDRESCTGKPLPAILPESVSRPLIDAIARVFQTGTAFRGSGRFDFPHAVAWLDTTIIPFSREGGEVVSVLGVSRNVTERVMLEQEMGRKGVFRLEQNMEQFQILNDQIRNPLQVIAMLASGCPESERILRQVAVIDDLVNRLDKGWAESVKVRSFLLRHYGHGEGMINPDRP